MREDPGGETNTNPGSLLMALDLPDFLVAVYCLIDDAFKVLFSGLKLRQRGPAPALSDPELVAMLVVGEHLSLHHDKAIWRYFQAHFKAWFPRLPCRSSFVRQAANLWVVFDVLRIYLLHLMGVEEAQRQAIDSFPTRLCRLARAGRCRRFQGQATLGYCASQKEWYHGFKSHLVVTSEGAILALQMTPANVDDREASWEILQEHAGAVFGDKGYLGRLFIEAMARVGIRLHTPLRKNMKDYDSDHNYAVCIARKIVETVISQLTERYGMNTTKARDAWHLTGRVNRKLLAHTAGGYLCQKHGYRATELDLLLAA